ncbi:MAG TPA: hypothetical protein EYQ26_17825 [Rhodospirillales bacterium]|nr:hypothetical protein [Rhodospirillales bacterium]
MVQKNIYKVLFIAFFLTVLSFEASAKVACSGTNNHVKRYWVADPPTNGEKKWWHDDANWSETSNGNPGGGLQLMDVI